jgi:hypothetical protein
MKGYIKEILICPECGGESTWNFDMAKVMEDYPQPYKTIITCHDGCEADFAVYLHMNSAITYYKLSDGVTYK